MNPLLITLLVVGGVVVIGIIWLIAIFNRIVAVKNDSEGAWSQIDVQLKRRHDLIPNLVETVKGYASHEKETLENVTQARNIAAGARGVHDQIGAEQALTGALGRLMLVAEQYPDLKANTNFLALQEELTSTENKITFARQHFNECVEAFNTLIESFPAVLVAGMRGEKKLEFFEISDRAEREVPKVEF